MEQAARGDINRLPCVFEHAVFAAHAVCELASRRAAGERESVVCASPLARAACAELYGLLREKSAFALRLTEVRHVLPHGKAVKVQCGGLDGLRRLIDPEAPGADVQRLLRAARTRYGTLAELPFSEIVKSVSAWRNRPGSRR